MNQTRNILLVENDPRDVEFTLEVLKQHHFMNQVDVARNGEEALDYLHRRGPFAGRLTPTPVVVLLDIKMPKLSGIEVLQEMKSSVTLKTIPVVMLTSSREDSDLRRCYELGVNAYVVKPVDFEQFRHAIREVGIFWVLVNDPPLANS